MKLLTLSLAFFVVCAKEGIELTVEL